MSLGHMSYRSIYRNLVLPLHCVLRRRSTLCWYDRVTRQQWMSADELAALQRQKLAALVQHCAVNVPFYRDLFQQHSIDPARVEDISILRNAGIRIGKQEIRSAGNGFFSQVSPRPRLYSTTSSGSTGEPVSFFKSMDTVCRRQAIKFRAEEWIGKPIGTRTTLIWGRLPPRKLHIQLGRFVYWTYQNYQFLSAFDIGADQLAHYVDRMTRFGTEFIESYVTAVHQMAKVIAVRKIKPPKSLRGIVVGAEQLVEEQRQFIESSFGCPVYNRYGSTEFSNIASECSHRRGLHINSDHVLVEVVDENDRPVIDEVGEIVVTDLDSYDMPLIRYRIGDRGVLSSEKCNCGRAFPMLRSINGRVSERLITRSGREIHDIFFIHSLAKVPGVAKFQVVQKSLDLVQVNLELEAGATRDSVALNARAGLAGLNEHGIHLNFNFVDRIPLSNAGKSRHFINEVTSPVRPPQEIKSSDKSKLQVVHVALQLDRGGLEKLLVEFARRADRERFDLRFVSITGRGSLAQGIEASGWPVFAMNEPPGLRPGMVLRLAKLFREWNVDIVHTHNTKPLLYAGPAAQLAGVRAVVHTCHGQRCGSSRTHTFMFVQACRCADRVICVSKDSAALRQTEGIPNHKVSAVWNGIDVTRFAYHGPVADGPAVLIARLSPEKDVETLLRATAILVRQHPAFRLDIAGDGPRSAALKQLAGELGIDSQVRFLGEVDDIREVMARASMLVLPSLTEGLSLSLLEAMAHGLPIVATRVGGNPEVVLDGQTGLLVGTGNPAELAGAMERIWTSPGLGQQMGRAGRARVEAHFEIGAMVAGYEAIYEELSIKSWPVGQPS
ncbi:MAG TPA: glycosyltransferase [Tepidisphaeraceae bacterium]|nr:glycosyltransferase [Tepidisphaeraceae bacterium]